MSNVNIRRAVENIRASTTVYTPVVEVIVNAIQAIDESGRRDGRVAIRAQRIGQIEIEENLPEISGFEVEDNGIGFTDIHRNSFDTLYTDQKITEGGKGFGRFMCLKYFESVHVSSIFRATGGLKSRKFSMGKDNDIIVHETVSPTDRQETGSLVTLISLKGDRTFDKKLSTIARTLVEKLLPYFITDGYSCPEIVLSEMDGSGAIRLNDYINAGDAAGIVELSVQTKSFTLESTKGEESFQVRIFKLYSPKSQKSKISLVAHKREVSGSVLQKYIPEFVEEFYEQRGSGVEQGRNYIVKAYVFGRYLDQYVSLERGGFEFPERADMIHGIGQIDIEEEVALIARQAMGTDITTRQEKKKKRVQSYVDEEAPWHKAGLDKVDITDLPYHATNEEIETRLQREKYARELELKKGVSKVLAEADFQSVRQTALEIVSKISDTSRNDLIHYIALRRSILEIFSKSLERKPDGTYTSEGAVHDIVFPRKGDTEITSFENHNLWILDERLNFTSYVSSDLPLNIKNGERPDLMAYDKRVLFRGDNEPSNPVTIFEFKRPFRDDFVNPSSKEDPIQQIVRYVNEIRDGDPKTPEDRKMLVAPNTPFYGYVVCDLTKKVATWLEREKNFTPMPDNLGWFSWIGNIKLYIEVVSWDKVLKDATMRNRIFFSKLGIS